MSAAESESTPAVQVTRFPGVLDSLSAIRLVVGEAAKRAGLDEPASYRLRLAVDEIATNIIVHGYAEAHLSGAVEVIVRLQSQALTIELEDTADAYDPTQVLSPSSEVLQRPMEERPVGGLGVMLARSGVDDFTYERTGGKNRTIFRVRRGGGTGGDLAKERP